MRKIKKQSIMPEKKERIKQFVLAQGNKFTNQQIAKRFNIEIMPLAGIIAGMKRNKSLKDGFMKSETRNTNTTAPVRTNRNSVIPTAISPKVSTPQFSKVAKINAKNLTNELIQGLSAHGETLIYGKRFYKQNIFSEIATNVRKSKHTSNLSKETHKNIAQLNKVVKNCEYIEVV